MPIPTQTICPLCQGKIEIDYILLGAAMACPHCHQQTTPIVPLGGTIPMNGYHLTFRDFTQLLNDRQAHPTLAPLLQKWLNATVTDPLAIHLQIQANSQWQYEVYQLAMNLWR